MSRLEGTLKKQNCRSLVIRPHEDVRANFLGMTELLWLLTVSVATEAATHKAKAMMPAGTSFGTQG